MKLTPDLLIAAYSRGYFPMAEEGKIYWYKPDPRAVIPLDGFHLSRSLERTVRRGTYEIRYDTAFEEVMRACGDRPEGTWMTEEFIRGYGGLFRRQNAHSVEAWKDGKLVGGTYGVAIGGAFFAESKFHRERDASKVALYHLVEKLSGCGYALLEVQFLTPHLSRLGAIEIEGGEYESRLAVALTMNPSPFVSETPPRF